VEKPRAGGVVVVGNVGIDTNVFTGKSFGQLTGEGHFSTNLDYIGQAGGYSCRGFAKLDVPTAFIGTVGDDAFGRWIRADLADDGIDLRGLAVDEAGTARSVNLMGPDGSRMNFYDGRGDPEWQPDPDLAHELFGPARLALFHLPNWARQLLPVARGAGCVIACDLQDVRDPADRYRADFVAAADILFVSAAHHPDPTAMLDYLVAASRGGLVICGLGAGGVVVATPAGVDIYPAPLLDLPLVDTNGAGDALAVGFLTAYVLNGRPVEEAVQYGQLAARWNCAQRASSGNLATPALLAELRPIS
jgi:acarbose 7IV-phosphotransferase